jgi:hypothetical protein
MLELAQRWRRLIEPFTGGDEGIRTSRASAAVDSLARLSCCAATSTWW